MENTLKYKDYVSSIQFNTEDEVFHGKILGLTDLVTFEGKSVSELKKAFKESIEDYLETCKALNKEPEKGYKGSFNIRVPMHLHKAAVLTASKNKLSLNEFMKIAISFAIKHPKEVDEEINEFKQIKTGS